MESIKAFDNTQPTEGLQITGTQQSTKRHLDVFPRNDEQNPLYVRETDTDLTFDLYQLNDFDETSIEGRLYVGLAKADGSWLLKNIKDATGEVRYANISNNGAYTSYADAWTDRLTLVYDYSFNITGV
jgi:hypothetical protein